jgi:hypothetical protein
MVHIVPTIVEHERIQTQLVFVEQQLLQLRDALERIVVVHREALQVIPGVVKQKRPHRRHAGAVDIAQKLGMHGAFGRGAYYRRFAGVPVAGNVLPNNICE